MLAHIAKGLTVTRNRVALFLVTMLLAVMAPMPVAAAYPQDSCNGRPHDPHFSTGAHGVIVKATMSCDDPGVKKIDFLLILWWCGNDRPKEDKTWLGNNCDAPDKNFGTIYDPKAGQVYTRYAPPVGQEGAKREGFYIGTLDWVARGPNGQDKGRFSVSPNSCYLSDGVCA